MVIVASLSEASIDLFGFSFFQRQAINAPAGIEQDRTSISRPVRSLNMIQCVIDHTAIFGSDRYSFQRAMHHRFVGGRNGFAKGDFPETRLFEF